MGSVWRISLVGRHRRAQSGGGAFVVPPSPTPPGGGLFHRSGGSSSRKVAAVPSVPAQPDPASSSQLSLRLPQASGSTYSLRHHQQPLHHPNLHLTTQRIVSASSGHSEASSVIPASTVSGGSGSSYSKATGVGAEAELQRTPSGKVRQRSRSRTRKLQDTHREQDLEREGVEGSKPNRRSVDFVFDTGLEKANVDPPGTGSTSITHQHILLPPIELQPPSPPRTVTQPFVESTTATSKGKAKEPNNNTSSVKSNARSLASALTAFDSNAPSLGVLSPT